MAKNLIPEIARMLGVELGEEFKVKGDDELTYKFTNDGLVLIQADGFGLELELADVAAKVALYSLLNGEDEIVKLPWKPKKGDTYFSFELLGDTWIVASSIWGGFPNEYALLDKGWVFCTCTEAKAALPTVAKKMGVKYEI